MNNIIQFRWSCHISPVVLQKSFMFLYIPTKAAIFFLRPFSYTAVAMPMLYNTRYSSRRRVTVMISVVWVLSFAISCPLLFGLNNTGKKE